jgi:protoporphyrinogen oxidase
LSGLAAGHYLLKGHRDIKILVIEAKDRLGGRTQTVELKCSKDGEKRKFDAGGQWV